MEFATDELYHKLTNIKTETEIIEARMIRTREHLEHTVNQIDTTKHLIFKGFHKANQRIRRMEGQVNEIARKVDFILEAVSKNA